MIVHDIRRDESGLRGTYLYTTPPSWRFGNGSVSTRFHVPLISREMTYTPGRIGKPSALTNSPVSLHKIGFLHENPTPTMRQRVGLAYCILVIVSIILIGLLLVFLLRMSTKICGVQNVRVPDLEYSIEVNSCRRMLHLYTEWLPRVYYPYRMGQP